jgi:hypothetical protein
MAECHRLGFVYKDERGLITTQPGRTTAGTLPLPSTLSSKTQLGRTRTIGSLATGGFKVLTGGEGDDVFYGEALSTDGDDGILESDRCAAADDDNDTLNGGHRP